MGSATKRPMHFWGRTAWVEPPLSREEVVSLTVSQRLLHLMIQQGGVWNSTRAVQELQAHGWSSTGKYPINIAGNMLMRWMQRGVLEQITQGVYTPRLVHMKGGQYLWEKMRSEEKTGPVRSDGSA